MKKKAYTIFLRRKITRFYLVFTEVEWDKKLSYLQKFKDKRFHYFGKKLLYQEKPDLLSKEDYDEIHGTIVKEFSLPTLRSGIRYQELIKRSMI